MNDERSYRGGIGLPQRSALQRRSTAPDTGHTRRSHHSHILRLTLMALLAILGLQGAWADTTLFTWNVNDNMSETTNVGSVTLTVGDFTHTIEWSGFAKKSEGSYTQKNGVNYYKFIDNDAYIDITLASYDFKAGDQIILHGYNGNNSNQDFNFKINGNVGDDYYQAKFTSLEDKDVVYTLRDADITKASAPNKVRIQRNDWSPINISAISVSIPSNHYPNKLYLVGNTPLGWSASEKYAATSSTGVYTWNNVTIGTINTGTDPASFSVVTAVGMGDGNDNKYGPASTLTITPGEASATVTYPTHNDWKVKAGIYNITLNLNNNTVTATTVQPLTAALTNLALLSDTQTSNFTTYTDWGANNPAEGQNSRDFKEYTYSNSRKVAVIADWNHYVTFDKTKGYTFHDPQDMVCAFLVMEPTSPGWATVSVLGTNPAYNNNGNRNKISINTSKAWDMNAAEATEAGGWKVRKGYATNPGRLYIAAYNGQTISHLQWQPYIVPNISGKTPSFKQNGNNVEITISKMKDLSNYSDVYFNDQYIEITNIDGTAQTNNQHGFNTSHDSSIKHTLNNVTSSVIARRVINYRDPSGGELHYLCGDAVTYTIVPAPQFSVADDGTISVTGQLDGYNYFYTTDGNTPNKYSTKLSDNPKLAVGTNNATVKMVAIRADEDVVTPVATKTGVSVNVTPKTPEVNFATISADNTGLVATVTTSGEGSDGTLGLQYRAVNGNNNYGTIYDATMNGATASVSYVSFGGTDGFGNTGKFQVRAVNKVSDNSVKYSGWVTCQIINKKAVFVNPDFETKNGTGWTSKEGLTQPVWNGGTSTNNCAERYQSKFDIYQQFTGLEDGVYEITAQAFYRTGAIDAAYAAYEEDPNLKGEAKILSYIYANDYAVPVKSLYSESFGEGTNYSYKSGAYYPNGMISAADAFSKGAYQVTLRATVTGGTLKVGIFGNGEGINDGRWTCWDNFSVKKISSDVPTTSLKTLPGSYKWSYTNGKFGKVGTEHNGSSSQPAVIVDNGYLEYDNRAVNNQYRKVRIEEDGLTLPASTWENGVHFIIPGPGSIIVKGKASVKNTNNASLFSNQGFVNIGTWPTTNNYRVVANATFNTNGVDGSRRYEYTGTSAAHVYIGVNASGCTNHIYEIEYIYNPGDLNNHVPIMEDVDDTNKPTKVTAYVWKGTNASVDVVSISKETGKEITSARTTQSSRSDNFQAGEITEIKNNYGNNADIRDLRIVAESDHPITVNSGDGGFTINAKSDGSTYGYLIFPAQSSGILKVWATPKAGADNSLVSVSAGEAPKDRWTEIPANSNEPAYTLSFFDNDPNRTVYIGGTEGVTITRIEWMPKDPTDADHKFLVPVSTEHPTSWAKGNNYGGFPIKGDGVNNTNIKVDILNPGTKANKHVPWDTEENTLLIYGSDLTQMEQINGTWYNANPEQRKASTSEQTNFSRNSILSLGRSTFSKERTENGKTWIEGDHFMEFLVTTPGVVKITGAGNGPSGRTIKVGTSLSSTIMEETHDDQPADKNDGEEHIGTIERHQHDSDHTFYCYFDGDGASADNPVSLYVYGRGGTNITELTWYPNQHIADVVQTDLVPEGALKISDAEGNVLDQNGHKKVPQNILLNSWDYTANDGEGGRKTNIADYSYKLYARVDIPTDKSVQLDNLAPVWTTSGRGRGGYQDYTVLKNYNSEVRMIGSQMSTITGDVLPSTSGNNSYVSAVYDVVPAQRNIAASADGNIAAYTHPGFGVNYVVAGTTEGNRADIRRIEVAGPPTGLDVLYHKPKTYGEGETNAGKTVYPVKVVKGKSASLTVNPFLIYHDIDNDKEHYVYGTDVRIKVDNPTVTWYESDINGNPLTGNVVDDVYTSSYLETPLRHDNNNDGYTPGDTDHDKDISTLLVGIKDGAPAGKTYITASINGIEPTYNGSNQNGYRAVKLIKVFEIEIVDKGLFLARVLPEAPETNQKPLYDANGAPDYKTENGNKIQKYETVSEDEKRVWDVSVTDPIVYKATGNITVAENGTDEYGNPQYTVKVDDQHDISANGMLLPLYLTASGGGTLEIPAKVVVKKIDAAYGETGDSFYDVYFVYDVVEALQNFWTPGNANSNGESKGYIGEHMNFDTNNNTEFSRSGRQGALYDYLGGYDNSGSDAAREKHNQYDFKFHTIPDRIGEELETFVYNVSQRTNAALNSDFSFNGETESRLLSDHIITNEWTTTYYKGGENDGEIVDEKTTKSWYGNKRSYIKAAKGFKRSAPDQNNGGRIMTLETTEDKAKLEITKYNGALSNATNGKRGIIKCIEINCEPDYSVEGNMGAISIGEYGDQQPINKNTNFTAVFDNLDKDNNGNLVETREANVWFHGKGMKIDQIKITYYSAVRDERALHKTFDSYSEDTWASKVASGIEMERNIYLEHYGYTGDNSRDSNIKLVFANPDTRHFALRESWERVVNEDLANRKYRGEKLTRNRNENENLQLEPDGVKTTLVIRDDKTEPCKFYIFTKDNVAEITSVELICEDDNRNNLSPRTLYVPSDPRFNPTEANEWVGFPFEQVENVRLVDGKEAGYSTGFHALRYRPESPTNMVYVSGDPNEDGFFFVRKIIVRYDNGAREQAYSIASTDNKTDLKSVAVTQVPIKTEGIKLKMPAENEVEAYTIKRTSLRTNLSSEVVLDEAASTTGVQSEVGDNHFPVLRDRSNGFSDLKHRKFYTVRVLDHNRLVTRQLSFHTKESTMPTIKYNNMPNTDLHAEADPISTLGSGDIKIQKSQVAENGQVIHEKNQQVIIYTTDGTAPSVTFAADGRTVESINGTISRDDVTLNSSELFTGGVKSIAIKAMVMPLKGNPGNSAPTIAQINNVGTYGETTGITRANYVYANPLTTYFTSARRDAKKGTLSINFLKDNATEKALYGIGSYSDRFHAGYATEVRNDNVKTIGMLYGGYELYNVNGDQYDKTSNDDDVKSDGFRRNIVKNDYWHVAANDLTPYRGLPGMIGGDAYVVSNLEPLHEGSLYSRTSNEIAHKTEPKETNGLRTFDGEFCYPQLLEAPEYSKIWQMPCYGDYFQYEPQRNGKLTVYVKQQGVLDQKLNNTLDDMLLRYRPVFVLDEAGKTPDNLTASTTSKVSGDWMTTTHTGLTASKHLNCSGTVHIDGSNGTVTYAQGQSATENLYNMCQAWIDDNTKDASQTPAIEYGDRAYRPQGVMNMYGAQGAGVYTQAENYRNKLLGNTRTSDGNKPNGFLIISEGYVKYEFDVKAGKTYFVFAQNGNLGMCSYEFVASGTQATDADAGQLGGADDDTDMSTDAAKKTYKTFAVKRKFLADKWNALVLPFSVSKSQLREVFGDGVHVSHFEYITDDVIHTRRHVHQMIVAGVPVFIKPTRGYSGTGSDYPVFKNVTVEVTENDMKTVDTNGRGKTDPACIPAYKCKGTFGTKEALNRSIYVQASTGLFVERTLGDFYVTSTRVWIEPTSSHFAKALSGSFDGMSFGADEAEDSTPTGVEPLSAESAMSRAMGDGVYNLNGQLVRKGSDSLEGLPAGVYIVNGIKQVVK